MAIKVVGSMTIVPMVSADHRTAKVVLEDTGLPVVGTVVVLEGLVGRAGMDHLAVGMAAAAASVAN